MSDTQFKAKYHGPDRTEFVTVYRLNVDGGDESEISGHPGDGAGARRLVPTSQLSSFNELNLTPRETNLEIAHKNTVNAKYALNAVACDVSVSDAERASATELTADAESLVERVQALRFRPQPQGPCMDPEDVLEDYEAREGGEREVLKAETLEALTELEEAAKEARRVVEATEIDHMPGDRQEIDRLAKRFVNCSRRYQEDA